MPGSTARRLYPSHLRGDNLRWPAALFLCGCILLGMALRLYELTEHGLWFDEILTAIRSGDSLGWLLLRSEPARFRPVLYIITHFSLLSLGESDFAVRLPAVIEGVLGVAVMYRVGKALFGRREGLLAAFLLAVSPFHIAHSQEARFYALMVLLSLGTVFFLWKALAGEGRRFWLGFAILSALNIYNHPAALLLLAGEIIFILGWDALLKVRPTWPGILLIIPALAGLAALGRLYYAALPDYVKFPLAWPEMSKLFSFSAETFSYFGAGGGFTFCLFLALFLLGLFSGRRAALLILSVIAPTLAVLPFIGGTYPLAYKYVVFILPMYLLGISRGVIAFGEMTFRCLALWKCQAPGIVVRSMAACLAAGALAWLSLVAAFGYYQTEMEDWRGLADFLRQNVLRGEAVISAPFSPALDTSFESHVLSYYNPIPEEGVDFLIVGSVAEIEEACRRYTRLWFALTPPYSDLEPELKEWLYSHSHASFHFYPDFQVLSLAGGDAGCLNSEVRASHLERSEK
ncbi:MAG: glycosyltransferase family 39 protein [Anaerolineae bacterium]